MKSYAGPQDTQLLQLFSAPADDTASSSVNRSASGYPSPPASTGPVTSTGPVVPLFPRRSFAGRGVVVVVILVVFVILVHPSFFVPDWPLTTLVGLLPLVFRRGWLPVDLLTGSEASLDGFIQLDHMEKKVPNIQMKNS